LASLSRCGTVYLPLLHYCNHCRSRAHMVLVRGGVTLYVDSRDDIRYDYLATVRALEVGQSKRIMPHDRCKRQWQLYAMLNIAELIVEGPLSKAKLLSRGLG
jgi:hypothetical protein